MKIRTGFVSNSSSSSFVIGLGKNSNEEFYKDKYPNINELKRIKKDCLKYGLTVPSEIEDIEESSGMPIENIDENSVYQFKPEKVNLPKECFKTNSTHLIEIYVEKLPKDLHILRIEFREE